MVTRTSKSAYGDRKNAIIKSSLKSTDYHVHQLFNHQKVDTASVTLGKLRRHTKAINPNSDPETDPFLHTAFLHTFLIETRRHLILQTDQSLTHLATLADLLESQGTDGVMNQMTKSLPTSETIFSEIDSMREMIVDLHRKLTP